MRKILLLDNTAQLDTKSKYKIKLKSRTEYKIVDLSFPDLTPQNRNKKS